MGDKILFLFVDYEGTRERNQANEEEEAQGIKKGMDKNKKKNFKEKKGSAKN